MKFDKLAYFLKKIEELASRNEITELIAEFFPQMSPEEAKYASYYIQGRIAPNFVDIEFNLSRKSLLNALTKTFISEKSPKLIKNLFSEHGDVGLVVETLLTHKKEYLSSESLNMFNSDQNFNSEEEMDILGVHSKLLEITKIEGKGSQELKAGKFLTLILALSPESAKYVSRIIVGKLRLGVSDKTLLDSLSWIITGDKTLRKELDKAYGAKSDIGLITQTIIESKTMTQNQILTILNTFQIEAGIPVAAKLVERESSPEAVWKRMPRCFVQPKLDGLRGQIHIYKSEKETDVRSVNIYSRNMENLTDQFPDLVEAALKLPLESAILDSEIIGINLETNEYLSYQETMQRKRKYDVKDFMESIPVKAECFDILYVNGKDLSTIPIEERLKMLREIVEKSSVDKNIKRIDMLETLQMKTEIELDDYFQEKVNAGLEGIITKETESFYEPGTRNYTWIKLKANSQSNLVDTIDVVVMGYYVGRGQRAKHGIGALLTGIYNSETDTYQTVGKVGSGIKDDEFPKIKADLEKIIAEDKPPNYEVENQLTPDFWVSPSIIIEIDADEITRSPSHTSAKGISSNVKNDKKDRGLSVRFPRLKIWNRDKQMPNNAKELITMYELSRERIGR